MKRTVSLSLVMFFLSTLLIGQEFSDFQRVASLPVTKNGTELFNAYAGGLNSIQASSLDVNADGLKDMVIFDREGNAFKVFLFEETDNGHRFVFDPNGSKIFPDSAFSMALFRDFNADGKPDLFTQYSPGYSILRLFLNTGGDIPEFTKVSESLMYQRTASSKWPLYTYPEAVPLIEDLDGDGDLDVVIPTETPTPNLFSLIQNFSVEEHGVTDKMDAWRLTSKCYGKIQEYGYDYIRPIDCPPVGFIGGGERQFGQSTLMALELDGDGNMDMLVTNDHVPNRLVALFNDSTGIDAFFSTTETDYAFPNYDEPVRIGRLTTCHPVDANNDGKNDLICGTNSLVGVGAQGSDSATRHNIDWYYENISTGAAPEFELQSKNFLTSTMIDVGANAYAAFTDLNMDGKPDMLIGREGSLLYGGEEAAGITSYNNVGSKEYPQYEWDTDSYTWWLQDEHTFEYFQFGLTFPAFGDLDSDGDDDLFLGNEEGKITYLTNVPVSGNARYVLTQPNYRQIDVGGYSKPVLFDLNSDGLLDLILGAESGKVSYFENKGTASSPDFNKAATITGLGGIDMATNGGMASIGFTRALDDDQKLYAVAAGTKGRVYLYGPILNISQNFPLKDSMDIEGAINGVCFANLLGDERAELVVSEVAGGVALFTMEENLDLHVPVLGQEQKLNVYPNPAHDKIYFEIPSGFIEGEVGVLNLQGQEVLRSGIPNSNNQPLDIGQLIPGFYIVKVVAGGQSMTARLVKQ